MQLPFSPRYRLFRKTFEWVIEKTNAVNLLNMAAANVTSLLELCTLNKKEESYISHSSILC